MPFQAKLSDFGVCVDLEAPEGRFTLDDYRGTPAWLAPEVLNGDVSRFGGFSPELMFRFDAYSFGMVLLSIFTKDGDAPVLDSDFDKISDQISTSFNDRKDIPSSIRMQLRNAVLSLLSEDPRARPLPSSALLKTDTPAYASWYVHSSSARFIS
jgi:serine/threonine protein kinase